MVSRSSSRLAARLLAALVALMLLTGCAIVPGGVTLEAIVGSAASSPASGVPASSAPTDHVTALRPRPRPGRFSMDLYRRNDHVPQYNGSWCIGASMQIMVNLMAPGKPDRSKSTQKAFYHLAREISPWVETRPGASVLGWAVGLGEQGYGTFSEMAAESRPEALRIAARQMRLTRRPVGLLVWRGAHAWVMSGFKATADPAYTDDFEVTAVWIEDPWAGRVSRRWGAGLAPHTLVTAAALKSDFVKWASRHRPEYGSDGAFVIVAPVDDAQALGDRSAPAA
jgi:hypothetical protein